MEFHLGSRPHVARKRTPRLPVSSENIKGEKFLSSTRQSLKKKADVIDDDDADEIKLVFTEASAKGGSPQVSQTLNKRTNSVMLSPVKNAKMKVMFSLLSVLLVSGVLLICI
jgi:hypothetical protein